MSSEELNNYIGQIKNPSETFERFLHHYVTGSIWIRSRGEEDISVWNRLRGAELELAKQIIINELKIVHDDSYMRAVSIFKDEKAIPVLMEIISTSPHSSIRLLAAKSLYDLTGYEDYVTMLDDACKNYQDRVLYDYLKVSIGRFVDGLGEADRLRITKSLDGNS